MDNVKQPNHYTQGSIECIDAIESALGKEGFESYCVGNVIKYVWRYKHKDNPLEDLSKAETYLGWAKKGLHMSNYVETAKRIAKKNTSEGLDVDAFVQDMREEGFECSSIACSFGWCDALYVFNENEHGRFTVRIVFNGNDVNKIEVF